MKIAVVGAGIVGLCAARALVARGADVTVFDPLAPGARSVHAAGIIEPTRAYRTNTFAFAARVLRYLRRGTSTIRSVDRRWLVASVAGLGRGPRPGQSAALDRLARDSLAEYARLSEGGNDIGYRSEGLLEVYRDPALYAAERRLAEGRSGTEPVDVRDGADGGGSLFFPALGWVHTERTVARLVAEIGADAFVRARAEAVASDGVVRVGSTERRFDGVVHATGVAARRWGLPITGVRGFGWHLLSSARIPCATIHVDAGVAFAPFADDLKATGGWDFDLGESLDHADRVFAAVRRLVPDARATSIDSGWRPCTPDGLPVVSRHDRVVVANGGFRLGWSFAPGLGAEAAELALDLRTPDPFLARYARTVRVGAT